MTIICIPCNGSETLSQLDLFQREMLTSEVSPTCSQVTCMDTDNATFSLGLEAGRSHSSLQDGRKISQSGPEAVHASHFPTQVGAKVRPTSVTCGLFGEGSSPSATLQQSLESRLRAALVESGSPLFDLTWKHWDMLSGLPICALRASARRTYGNDYSSWPTPRLGNGGTGNPKRAMNGKARLEDTVFLAAWPTPNHNSTGPGNQRRTGWNESSNGGADAGRMGVSDGERSSKGCETAEAARHGHSTIATDWDDLEWLPCIDGKWRPTQPGLHPLAHGVPVRVGQLRAYGNAIVPQIAAEFIKAAMSAV